MGPQPISQRIVHARLPAIAFRHEGGQHVGVKPNCRADFGGACRRPLSTLLVLDAGFFAGHDSLPNAPNGVVEKLVRQFRGVIRINPGLWCIF